IDRKIKLVERRNHGWCPPVNNGLHDLPALVFGRSERHHQAEQVVRIRSVDVVLCSLWNDFHLSLARRELHAEDRRGWRISLALDEQDSPLDCPGRQIITAESIHGGRGAFRFSPYRGGQRKCDRRQRQRQPKNGQQSAALSLLPTPSIVPHNPR